MGFGVMIQHKQNPGGGQQRIGDGDDDDSCTGLAFLFEAAQSARTEYLQFFPGQSGRASSAASVDDDEYGASSEEEGEVVRIVIRSVKDDDPGALQSGHYLWPAAAALAQHLVDVILADHDNCCDGVYSNEDTEKKRKAILPLLDSEEPMAIIELGAGCGLVGLAMLQAFAILGRRRRRRIRRQQESTNATSAATTDEFASCCCIAFTDHDAGTLARAQDSYDATLERLRTKHNTSDKNMPGEKKTGVDDSRSLFDQSLADDMESIPVMFELLKWGDSAEVAKLAEVNKRKMHFRGYDIVVGSDLIYCHNVVLPLLQTAKDLMERPRAVFVLAQSFPYDSETEKEIDRSCHLLGLSRTVLEEDTLLAKGKGGIKVQTFAIEEWSLASRVGSPTRRH